MSAPGHITICLFLIRVYFLQVLNRIHYI